jgi:acyl dehydratase
MTTEQQLFTYDESAVGVEVEAGQATVTRELIAAYCETLGETNPLWTDDEWATTKGPYRGIVAPPALVTNLPARGNVNAKVKFGNSSFLGGRRIEVFDLVRPGDTITMREQIKDVYAKTGRTGTMVFAIRRVSYFNQHGTLVSISDTSSLYRETSRVTPSGPPDPAEEAPEPEHHRARDIEGQRTIDDIEPADEFEGTWEVTKEQVAGYLELGRIAAPPAPGAPQNRPSYFLDDNAAANNGLTRPIAHGGLSTAICMRLITDWIGPRGRLKSIDASFRRPAMHGDRLRVVGLVTDVNASGPEAMAKVDVYLENEKGDRPIQGVAEITLPRRGE